MKNYDLYATYAMQFGLTFLPKEFNDASWEVATELMTRALAGIGPEVTHALIDQHLKHRHMRIGTDSLASSPELDRCLSVA